MAQTSGCAWGSGYRWGCTRYTKAQIEHRRTGVCGKHYYKQGCKQYTKGQVEPKEDGVGGYVCRMRIST